MMVGMKRARTADGAAVRRAEGWRTACATRPLARERRQRPARGKVPAVRGWGRMDASDSGGALLAGSRNSARAKCQRAGRGQMKFGGEDGPRRALAINFDNACFIFGIGQKLKRRRFPIKLQRGIQRGSGKGEAGKRNAGILKQMRILRRAWNRASFRAERCPR